MQLFFSKKLLVIALFFLNLLSFAQPPTSSGCSVNDLWKLSYRDEFSYPKSTGQKAIDNIKGKWDVQTNPHGHDYVPPIEITSNGFLKIKNQLVKSPDPKHPYVRGAWVGSKRDFAGKGDIKYGFYEARIRINRNDGEATKKIWPTWWIWDIVRPADRKNAPYTGNTEFDLMEYSAFTYGRLGGIDKATSSHHYLNKAKKDTKKYPLGINTAPTRGADGKFVLGPLAKTTTWGKETFQHKPTDANIKILNSRDQFNFHRWGLLWTPTEVTFYYDGKPYLTSDFPEDAARQVTPIELIFSSSPHTRFNKFSNPFLSPDVKDANGNTKRGEANPLNTRGDISQRSNPYPADAPKLGDKLASFEIDYVRVWEYRKGNFPNTGRKYEGHKYEKINKSFVLKESCSGTTSNVIDVNKEYYITSHTNTAQRLGVTNRNVLIKSGDKNDVVWKIKKSGNSYTVQNVGSKEYLEVFFGSCGGNKTQNTNDNITTWTGATSAHQKWDIKSKGNGNYIFVPTHCRNRAMDRFGGKNAQLFTFKGPNEQPQTNQLWKLVPVSKTAAPQINNNSIVGSAITNIDEKSTYFIQKPGQNNERLGLDGVNARIKSGSNTDVRWQFKKVGGTTDVYTIESVNTRGRFLEVPYATCLPGNKHPKNTTGNVGTFTNSSGAHQRWRIRKWVNDVIIVPVHCPKTGIDRFGGSTTANAQLFTFNNGKPFTNQRWRLVKAFASAKSITTVQDQKLKVTPNPVKKGEDLFIETALENVEVTVYNLLGKEIYRGTSKVINTSGFPQGVYIIKLVSRGNIITRKIVVM